MPHITTKNGDAGHSLVHGQRVPKNSPLFATLGLLDETQAWLLLLSTHDSPHAEFLREIAYFIHALMAYASGYITSLDALPDLTERMEFLIANTTSPRDFAYPDNQPAAYANLARTVARHAERAFISTLPLGNSDDLALQFLNRLSDYLFIYTLSLGGVRR
jgi:cob(I)alamin adenosyltransferase